MGQSNVTQIKPFLFVFFLKGRPDLVMNIASRFWAGTFGSILDCDFYCLQLEKVIYICVCYFSFISIRFGSKNNGPRLGATKPKGDRLDDIYIHWALCP